MSRHHDLDAIPPSRVVCPFARRSSVGITVGGAFVLIATTAVAEPSSPSAAEATTSDIDGSPSESPRSYPATGPAPAVRGAEPNAAPSRPVAEAPRTAQADDENEDATEGAGGFFVGAGLFDVSSLNDHLAANGYERLGSFATLLGGEGRAVFESGFVAGARGAAILSTSGNGPSDMQAQLNGGFGMVDFGFALVRTRAILLTLTGGIGGYGRSLDIGTGKSASFDEVLKNPARSVSLGQGGLLVGATLGFDGRVPVGHTKRGRRGFFTLGLRVGGLYGPAMGGWSISQGGDANGGPTFALAGGYAALVIGFGGGAAEAQRVDGR